MNRFSTILCAAACFLLSISGTASAETPETSGLERNEALVRFTYDHLHIPGGEHLGLVGGNYLLAVRPWLHAGIGVYGAVSGRRGGFFTGGFEADLRQPLPAGFSLNGGLFIGGGGGGSAPQGGGFMLRPHAELLYDTGYGSVGVGVSDVWFPNGDINSAQVAFTYEYPLESLLAGGWLRGDRFERSMAARDRERPLAAGKRAYSVTSEAYLPASGMKEIGGKRGDKAIGLLGAEMRQYLGGDLFMRLAAAGAVAGDADGFAQVQLGAGYRLPLPGHNALSADLSVGAAGGGRVDTGGGFITAMRAGVQHWFSPKWAAGVQGGYVAAPGGEFRAPTVGVNLTYETDPSGQKHVAREWSPGWWRVRGGSQSYLPVGRIRKSGSDNSAVNLVAAKLDRMFSDNFYLTGQALAAYNGGAGGYAVGLVGAGWTAPLWADAPLFANGELLLGAGGGGNISTGGGLLLQPMAGIGWMFNRQAGILVSAGGVTAPDGRLGTAIADIALVYHFTTAEQR